MMAFPQTLAAAQSLLNELRCDSCSRLLHRPNALAGCEHLLCATCSDALTAVCPVCGVPCRPKDVLPQQSLHELTFAAVSLARLLSEKSPPPPQQQQQLDASLSSASFSSASSARPCRRNARGETPLHVAAAKGALERVRSLVAAGAEVNAVDNAGWTPLHEAVIRGHVEVAEQLLQAGAFVNALGCGQDTPLHDAVENRRLDCVRLLLRHGADAEAVNAAGRTPKQLAEACPEVRAALQTRCEVAPAPHIAIAPFQPPVFLLTGLNRKERMLVHKVATLLRAELVPEMTSRVTHLICRVNAQGTCPRTLKYLHAVLQGCWVVDFEWAQSCLALRQHVTEEPFEVGGCSSQPNSMAARRARESAAKGAPGLFDGCAFHFEGNFSYPTPSREELGALVRRGGAEVLLQRPKEDKALQQSRPAHAVSSLRHCSAFLVRDGSKSDEVALSGGFAVVRPNWIMNCCAAFRLVEP